MPFQRIRMGWHLVFAPFEDQANEHLIVAQDHSKCIPSQLTYQRRHVGCPSMCCEPISQRSLVNIGHRFWKLWVMAPMRHLTNRNELPSQPSCSSPQMLSHFSFDRTNLDPHFAVSRVRICALLWPEMFDHCIWSS